MTQKQKQEVLTNEQLTFMMQQQRGWANYIEQNLNGLGLVNNVLFAILTEKLGIKEEDIEEITIRVCEEAQKQMQEKQAASAKEVKDPETEAKSSKSKK